jgi:hypothetical protein
MSSPGTLRRRVDQYARKRASSHGDLYGWTILSSTTSDLGQRDEVLFFVAEKADSTTFPDEIAGYKVRLKRMPAPELQVVR